MIAFHVARRIKFKVFLMGLVISLCGCNEQKYSGEMDVVNSKTLSFDNCYSEDITVIANLPQIDDYEEYAENIIEHYILNDFESTDFTFDDVGYPNELRATVFLTSDDLKKWEPIFEMTYKADYYGYTIKENPENCTLEIKLK